MSLNDYEILKQIGTGAFSTVSLVKCKKDNLIYALKRVELNKMMPNEKDNIKMSINISVKKQYGLYLFKWFRVLKLCMIKI